MDFATIVQTVGFPIAAAIATGTYIVTRFERVVKDSQDCIKNNTEALGKIGEQITYCRDRNGLPPMR